MRSPVRRSVIGTCSLISASLIYAGGLRAQVWEHVRTVHLGSVPENASVALAMDGDVLAVSICTENGGATRVLARHQDGLDQWGVMRSIVDPQPWSGYSLALRNDLLAVGSPGANSAGPFTGAVRMFHISPQDLTDPVQEVGSIVLPDAVGNDRFGYALAWAGDTLLVSAVDRSSYHMTGAVFLFADGPQGFHSIGALPALSTDIQVSFTRWFGRSIAATRDRIAVSAPYSGFDIDYAEQNIGAIHIFERDASSATGWALDTAWYDAALDPAQSCLFERVELGKEGLAFIGEELIMDHSERYAGTSGSVLEPWQSHDPGSAGCPECGLRIVDYDATLWDLDGSHAPAQDLPLFQRGVQGWCVDDETLYIAWYDAANTNWRTSIHHRDEGGSNAWGITAEIPELDDCDDLRGPMIVSGDHLVRTSLRRGADCGVEDGSVEVELQIFQL